MLIKKTTLRGHVMLEGYNVLTQTCAAMFKMLLNPRKVSRGSKNERCTPCWTWILTHKWGIFIMTLRNLFLYKKLISSENKDHRIEVCFSFSCSSIKEIQYVLFFTLYIFKHSSALRSFIQLYYNRKRRLYHSIYCLQIWLRNFYCCQV